MKKILKTIYKLYSKNPTVIISCLLFIITLITYGNILPNKLFFDDEELIYKNIYVADISNIPRFFIENMVAGAGKVSNMYRPVLMTSFSFDHLFWGNNPTGYHITSILLHGANSVLAYILIYMIFKRKFPALLAALFFAVHPVNSEAVIYASGRTDPLYSFFALLSLLSFTRYIILERINKISFISTVIFFILSLFSKETAIILPLIYIVIAFFLNDAKKLKKTILILLPIISFCIFYIFLRLTFLNFANTLNFYSDSNIYSRNLPVRLLTFTKVFFEYLKVLVFPRDLIIARTVPIISTVINTYTIVFLLFFSFCVIIFLIFRKKIPILLFSFLWFFIFLIPVSGIIPINNIITEHYLYLPSVGFFLFISFLFEKIWRKLKKFKIALSLFIIIIIIVLSVRTVWRTFDWRDPVTFYQISLKQSPWHIPMRHNLAMAYSEKGQLDIAIQEYKNIIKLGDFYPNTHHNLANIYKSQGKYKEAEAEYFNALKLNPNFYFSYYALAELYQTTGEKDKFDRVMNLIESLKK